MSNEDSDASDVDPFEDSGSDWAEDNLEVESNIDSESEAVIDDIPLKLPNKTNQSYILENKKNIPSNDEEESFELEDNPEGLNKMAEQEHGPPSSKKTKYFTSFQDSWLKNPSYKNWLIKENSMTAKCALCSIKFTVKHDGEKALKTHASSKKHVQNLKMRAENQLLTAFILKKDTAEENLFTEIEVSVVFACSDSSTSNAMSKTVVVTKVRVLNSSYQDQKLVCIEQQLNNQNSKIEPEHITTHYADASDIVTSDSELQTEQDNNSVPSFNCSVQSKKDIGTMNRLGRFYTQKKAPDKQFQH
ncbi:hypothetical protein RN001_016207 [Aquatica leii]|uniref:Uncharacterized protein n=1 Tax=Aquatica leii TaxID=1421715 RepID=A0AAN7SKB8_9COLE|nr:hypothetical protein RN001_016207 [Aquatica leii]